MPRQKRCAEAYISRGAVVIRVPIQNLNCALDGAWAAGNYSPRYRLTDPHAFAKEFIHELNREAEDGATPIHKLFDKCMYAAIEQGAEGVEEHPEQDA
jgi:hypothetical protein